MPRKGEPQLHFSDLRYKPDDSHDTELFRDNRPKKSAASDKHIDPALEKELDELFGSEERKDHLDNPSGLSQTEASNNQTKGEIYSTRLAMLAFVAFLFSIKQESSG